MKSIRDDEDNTAPDSSEEETSSPMITTKNPITQSRDAFSMKIEPGRVLNSPTHSLPSNIKQNCAVDPMPQR